MDGIRRFLDKGRLEVQIDNIYEAFKNTENNSNDQEVICLLYMKKVGDYYRRYGKWYFAGGQAR